MKQLIILLSFLSLGLTSCFAPQTKSISSGDISGKKSLITSSDFAGAVSATNTITGIKVVWNTSNVEATAYRVYSVAGTTMTLLASLPPTVTSFIDGTAQWGSIYAYIVRAVDIKGVEDNNAVQVSSLAWAGISSIDSSARTSLTVQFADITPIAEEIRIYVVGDSSEDPIIKTTTGSTTAYTINGLRAGYTYKVSAQAYVKSLKKEDGNTKVFNATTLTNSYDEDPTNSSKPGWMSVTNVRAFGPAAGAAVSASTPNKTPQSALVELSFKSFIGYGSSTKYVVTRTLENVPFDTSVATPCSKTSMSSCRVTCNPATSVAELTGTGVLHCRDEQVGNSPLRYRYTMSLLQTTGTLSWIEPLTAANTEKYSVLVPMPPEYMVLVHRDAVNYEMCSQQLNLTPDPSNHNRCEYRGIGAVPYNSGPNKPALNLSNQYYDFGYNLFVDRYDQGCKWTRSVDGGMCGPGGTAGDCVVNTDSAPDNNIGKNGDVLLVLLSGISSGGSANASQQCYYKANGSWVQSNNVLANVSDGATVLSNMFTSNPQANGGLVSAGSSSLSAYHSNIICQGKVDPNYGVKRIPRMREYRAYSTFPTVPNDLYYTSYSKASSLSGAGSTTVFNDVNGWRCPINITTTSYPPMASVNSVATMLASPTSEVMGWYTGTTYWGGRNFRLNAQANVDCQGRYGIQNVHNRHYSYWVSDNFLNNAAAKTLTGTASFLDNGNFDLAADIVSPSATSYTLTYGQMANSNNYYLNLNSTPVTFFAMTLGLPILSSSVTGYTSVSTFTEPYGTPNMYMSLSTTNTVPRGVRVNSRWELNVDNQAVTGTNTVAVRCVMSAD